MLLGDLGADVLKVEAPGHGDETRAWQPPSIAGESTYFLSVNRNKRSLTLNLKEPTAQTILRQLIAQSDVLIENFKVGTLEKLGFSYAELQKIRPDLIYATITGYGYTSPNAQRAGYDFMIQAEAGLMSVTGEPNGHPVRAGVAIADLSTGLFASNAILAALFARERTQQGQRVDIALYDSQLALSTYLASNFLISGQPPQRLGNAHPSIVPYQEFLTQDQRYLAFGIGNDRQWQLFCQAVGQPAWATDPRYSTNSARIANRAAVVEMTAALFATRPAEAWLALCEQLQVPCAPVQNFAEIFASAQVQARHLLQWLVHPIAGKIPQLGSPMHIPTDPVTLRLPPPTLGQHTTSVLCDLGYTALQIAQLQQMGAV